MQNKTTWLLATLLLAGVAVSAQWKKIEGNGKMTKQNRPLTGFQSVSLAGGMKVQISTSANTAVTVEADENLQDYIITEVKSGSLKIKLKEGYSVKSNGITVYVTMPSIEEAVISGSGTIRSENEIPAKGNFDAIISGSGTIDMHVKSESVKARISGSGNISLAGSTSNVDVVISGSGSFKGFSMPSSDASVKISGSGNVETTVNGHIDAVISGSGNVYYKGKGEVSLKSSGSGRLKKVD
jgi:hypothetical protein